MRTREVIELMTLGNMRAASSAWTCGPHWKEQAQGSSLTDAQWRVTCLASSLTGKRKERVAWITF